jgi:aminopeptidase N
MQFTQSKEFLSRYKALTGIKDNLQDPASVRLLNAALKDSFFRIRIKALDLMDLTKTDQAKVLISDVEKLAVSDPKTLVQAAAVTALAKTKTKNTFLYLKKEPMRFPIP